MTDVPSGRFVQQAAGYRAFVPAPLPPEPPLVFNAPLQKLLSDADQAIGRLDGYAELLPNPDLFVAMYVRREAVLSSQIEGTESTLDDVLRFELDPRTQDVPDDVEEIVNYVRAMSYGLERISTLPLSLRFLREIHAELLSGVRGQERQPGEFRRTQNWIGPSLSLSEATFVPPPPVEMNAALNDFEHFLHEQRDVPTLVYCGLAHAQFETIHPFSDGNGRVGRLLIAFLLVYHRVLHRPLLYLSYFLKRHQAEYYDRLMAIRLDGDWEGWLRFFVRGVAETAAEATVTARAIVSMREDHRALVESLGLNALRLVELLFEHPIVSVNMASARLGATGVTFGTANQLVAKFERLGLLKELTGGLRNRQFSYRPYLDLFRDPEVDAPMSHPDQTAEGEE